MRSNTTYQVLNAFKDIVKKSSWFQATTSSFLPIGSRDIANLSEPSAQEATYARSQASSPATLKTSYQYQRQDTVADLNRLDKMEMRKKNVYFVIEDSILTFKFISSTDELVEGKIKIDTPEEVARLSKLAEIKSVAPQSEEKSKLYKAFKKYVGEFIENELKEIFPLKDDKERQSLKTNLSYAGRKASAAQTAWTYYISLGSESEKPSIIITRKPANPKDKKIKTVSHTLDIIDFLNFLNVLSNESNDDNIVKLAQAIVKDQDQLNELISIHDVGSAKVSANKARGAAAKALAPVDPAKEKAVSDAEQLLFTKIVELYPQHYYIRGTQKFQKMKAEGLIKPQSDPSKSGGMFSTIGGITAKPQGVHVEKSTRLLDASNAMVMKEKLDDSLLAYKHSKVKYICENLQKLEKIKVSEAQLSAKGVFLNIDLPDFIHKHYPSQEGTANGIDRFYTHLLIAYINSELYKNNVGGYIDRRQSFGFMLSSATDVHKAIRLSIGLVPNKEWMTCVINGIKNFDTFIKNSEKRLTQINKDDKNGIHQAYHRFATIADEGGKSPIDSYMHHLFLDTLLKNDEATLDDVIKLVLENTPKEKGKMEIISQRLIEINRALFSREHDKSMKLYKDADEKFKQYCQLLIELYNNLLEKYNERKIDIDLNDPTLTVDEVMRKIRDDFIGQCQKACVTYYESVEEVEATSEEDDMRSDLQRSKFFNTVCGMEALYSPAIIYKDVFSPKKPIRIYRDEHGYFELTGFMEETFTSDFFTKDENPRTAQIYYADVNPCLKNLNGKKLEGSYLQGILDELERSLSDGAIVILDCTSTSRADKELIRKNFDRITAKNGLSCILCLSESSLKNRGLGLEIPHGTIEMQYSNKFKEKMAASPLSNEAKFNDELVNLRSRSSALSKHMRRDLREALQKCDNEILSKVLPQDLDAPKNLGNPALK